MACAKTCCSTELLPHGVAVSLCAGIRRQSYWHSSQDNVHAHIKAEEMLKKARRGIPVQKENKVVCYLTNNAVHMESVMDLPPTTGRVRESPY